MENIEIVSRYEIVDKGEKIYEKMKDKLEAEHEGEFVAIEVNSGNYFLGKSPQEADGKASEKYPNRVFYLVRVGRKAAFVRR